MPEYQSLYRKYRSQTFADLVGQDASSRALQGAITSGRVAHAYLFSGSRGTGKTSAARLLAKALNCTGRPRDSAEPCNKCQSCVEVIAGSALDLIEIDAASNRGIDEIRDLREKVNLSPALGPYKVYIIDEAHMLTEPAFNALLKTLEEPPAHVVFVLCTTDAQKIPLTVIGRCQQFVFRRHSEEQIISRLTHIAKSEKVQVEPEAMRLIARTAQGSMRDAVGLLDQLVPLASGPISLDGARSLLGIADPRLLDSLLDHVLAGQAAEALTELNRVYSEGAELRQVVRGLMEGCRDRLVASLTRHDQPTARRLSTVLDALLHLDGEVRRHAEPRLLVEATLARLAVEAGTDAPVLQEGSPPPEARSASGSPQGGEVKSPVPVSGWNEVLEKLNRTVRAAYLDAQPEVDGSVLVLWFRYGFHHKKAQEQSAQLMPHVRAWLGDDVKIDFRLRENDAAKSTPRPASPEDDPFVREIVRRFDGRVTRVKEVSE
ncbi:MAG: DNA polymerase III subunit gamma/tau [Chloroflexi bacterium]|nr:MAG: DNA polymerase III subunit gamma/tau [Chloroflexota bacterium]TME48537.1 MAG: DNA polymerase III subunit gamma/tau [Chloroflexota bacterium]TMF39604.1 MAG: DNA polymerase III subunit gamma/tau [Chloroflexota bacterium]